VDDRERAEKFCDEWGSVVLLEPSPGRVRLHFEEPLAAEFAAIRAPLERRIDTLEAALEKATKEIGGWSGRETEDLYEQCRAALAGAPEREEK
jgi:hypothetical protein